MANYYSHTALRRAPEDLRLTKTEHALLRLMGFDTHPASDEDDLYAFCSSGLGLNDLTVETIREEMKESTEAERLAEMILAAINYELCDDGTDEPSFDYADLFYHALVSRGSKSFVQFSTAHTCDKARREGFGGTALHITADGIDSMDTDGWLREKAGITS